MTDDVTPETLEFNVDSSGMMTYGPATSVVPDSCAWTKIYNDPELLAFYKNIEAQIWRLPSLENERSNSNTPMQEKDMFHIVELKFKGRVLNEFDQQTLDQIRRLYIGNGSESRYGADADHIVDTIKVGGIFLTEDDRILRKSDEIRFLLYERQFDLWRFLPSKFIFTPYDFMQQWNAQIQQN